MGDYYWKLKVNTGRKFDPSQPRVPAGDSRGGQWTSDGGQSQGVLERFTSGLTPTTDYRQKGFLVPNGDFYAVINHPGAAANALGEQVVTHERGSRAVVTQFLSETGAVRITNNGYAAEIVAPVTRAQRDILEMLTDWRTPMRVDISDVEGKNLASFDLDYPEDMRALLKAVPEILSQSRKPPEYWDRVIRFSKSKDKKKIGASSSLHLSPPCKAGGRSKPPSPGGGWTE